MAILRAKCLTLFLELPNSASEKFQIYLKDGFIDGRRDLQSKCKSHQIPDGKILSLTILG